jgi:hypothetical protein
MELAQAPGLIPFSGELPGNIDPTAHGLPFNCAAELFGAPDACFASRDALRVVWVCGGAASFATIRAAVASALRAGVQALALDLPAPPPRPIPLAGPRSVQATNEFRRQDIDAQEVADQLARLPQAAARLLEAERARRASFYIGLQTGLLQAFGRLRDRRGPWVWIGPQEWRGPGALAAVDDGSLHGGGLIYRDAHVHDRFGAEIQVARLAYGPPDLVGELEQATDKGDGLTFMDWDGMRRAHALWRRVDERLADDVEAGRLVSELPPARDAWTGKWQDGVLDFVRLRLPSPGGAESAPSPGAPNPDALEDGSQKANSLTAAGPRGLWRFDAPVATELIAAVDRKEYRSDWAAAQDNESKVEGASPNAKAKRLHKVMKQLRSGKRSDT